MEKDIYCPIFKVGDILSYAQQNFSELANTVKTNLVYNILKCKFVAYSVYITTPFSHSLTSLVYQCLFRGVILGYDL